MTWIIRLGNLIEMYQKNNLSKQGFTCQSRNLSHMAKITPYKVKIKKL
jgi:hypothetical protein